MIRCAQVERKTLETEIRANFTLDGNGKHDISTGIGFFDHMLTLFCVHGLFDLNLQSQGDLHIDFHHTVEDVGLVLGEALTKALGDRKGINRYGYAIIPMDDALVEIAIDLSNRPYLVFHFPDKMPNQNGIDTSLAMEFFRAVAQRGGMNMHIAIVYGENWHHMIEAVFKGLGRALRNAVALDRRTSDVPSSKGYL